MFHGIPASGVMGGGETGKKNQSKHLILSYFHILSGFHISVFPFCVNLTSTCQQARTV